MSRKEILYPYGEEGICTYEYTIINGIRQYIQIRGSKKTNPIMLFIHGGPGGAISGLCHVMQLSWEEEFTIVNWDQRNSGKTYCANREKSYEIGKTGSLSDYMKDIDDVIAYLHTKYEFNKIYIMGFSWGSVIGAEYAKRYPENVAAYIGVGQAINYEKGFMLVCEKAKEIANSQNNQKDVAKLTALIDNYPAENVMTTDRMKSARSFAMLANKYLVKNAKPFPFMQILLSPFLSFKEKKAMFLSDINLYQETYKTLFSYDFISDAAFEVPMYFISGVEDINCPVELLRSCVEDINAPDKKLYEIEAASHMCFYDQAEKFIEILTQIKHLHT